MNFLNGVGDSISQLANIATLEEVSLLNDFPQRSHMFLCIDLGMS